MMMTGLQRNSKEEFFTKLGGLVLDVLDLAFNVYEDSFLPAVEDIKDFFKPDKNNSNVNETHVSCSYGRMMLVCGSETLWWSTIYNPYRCEDIVIAHYSIYNLREDLLPANWRML